ncbi:MAG: hypothetical protein MI739_03135, partial [Bacteroidales bacterium]|nr:hypothetical protein [Bacteroidales bacterium]
MRIITTALVLCLTLFATAQPDSLLAQKIDTLRKQEKYIQIIETLQTNLKTNNDLWTNYQLACYYSLTNDSSNAFYFLNKSIKKGADGKDILTDTDFENIHKCTNWSAVVDTLEKIHLTNNIGITHPELCVELWHIYIEDQRFRTLLKNYKKTFPKFRTPEYTEFSKQQRPLIKARKKRAKKIIKKYGWPTYTMVGKESAEAIFLIFQHAEFKYLKKYLPLLKKAAFAGEASKKHYAMMYDRYLMYDGKKQCYGTQLTRSSSGINPDGSPKWGKLVFHPIENPETINQRRAEMGMTTIEKEAKKWKIEYNPNADVKL